MENTLTYSQSVQGWPSFYSYHPDFIIGMNNYLYTFKGGDLYRHNVNTKRNTFYEQYWNKVGRPLEAFKPSQLKSVFNAVVLENKLFKTIDLEGDSVWDFTLYTDLQDSGIITSTWFEKKEASYFAFIRNTSSGEIKLRSLNGIGKSYATNIVGTVTTADFSVSPMVSLGSIISIGDLVYFLKSTNVPLFAGKVSAITVDYPAGVNRLTIDTSPVGTVPLDRNNAYFLYIKNSVAESHGVLGHYCVFDITNSENKKVELFTVQSEVMKSFP